MDSQAMSLQNTPNQAVAPAPMTTTQPSGSNVAPAHQIFQRLDTNESFPYSFSEYVRRALWELVQATLIRFSPRKAHRWRAFWLRAFGARLGVRCYLKNSTRVKHPWLLSVGSYSCVAEDVNVYNLGPITIGDHTCISQGAHLCAGTHDFTKPSMPLVRPPIVIGSGVWICAEAFIGPNVTVGDNSIVGARAVVNRDVPPNVIVAGNPAVVVRDRPLEKADD